MALNLTGVKEETEKKHTDFKSQPKGGPMAVIQKQRVNILGERFGESDALQSRALPPQRFLPPKVESTETYRPYLFLKACTELLYLCPSTMRENSVGWCYTHRTVQACLQHGTIDNSHCPHILLTREEG